MIQATWDVLKKKNMLIHALGIGAAGSYDFMWPWVLKTLRNISRVYDSKVGPFNLWAF
jgi:hypothetical protein